MMKRVLCFMLCLLLAVPAAMADTADTLPKKFNRQLTGGNGIRGKISLTASGAAEWLDVLLPFTAADIQLRAIGEKQGEKSDMIADDDDWQVHLYTENSAGKEVGTTWIYGDPTGVYFQSELIPNALLTIPVEQVNLLYQIFKGEFDELLFAFDPFGMTQPGANGNPSAYQPLANILGIPAEEWEAEWLPVLEKYFLQLDLWLTSYGDPSFMTGETGGMTMSATYTIPAEDLKKEAKYIIGQMLFDNDLQSLLVPYVTLEEQIIYLNPSLVYFYEACIDALPLQGDVILSREMSSMGETVSTTVALPLPVLPENITGPVGMLAATLFKLPYEDLLNGMTRISFTSSGNERSMNLSGEKRSVSLSWTQEETEENGTELNGSLRITPNVGVDENSLSAAYSCMFNHRVWQDESYIDHDSTEFSIAFEPDLDMLSEDDPFRSTYVDFAPVGFELAIDYRNNAYQANSAVQINVEAAAKLPDAEVAMDMVLRVTTKVSMETLATAGAENLLTMTNERRAYLLDTFTENAINTMAGLNAPAAEVTAVPAAEPTAEPTPEPTAVPPVIE